MLVGLRVITSELATRAGSVFARRLFGARIAIIAGVVSYRRKLASQHRVAAVEGARIVVLTSNRRLSANAERTVERAASVGGRAHLQIAIWIRTVGQVVGIIVLLVGAHLGNDAAFVDWSVAVVVLVVANLVRRRAIISAYEALYFLAIHVSAGGRVRARRVTDQQ